VIDHSSSVSCPIRSGAGRTFCGKDPGDRIYVTGNPIKEVIDRHGDRIGASNVLSTLASGGKYFLVTMHRAENVDVEDACGAWWMHSPCCTRNTDTRHMLVPSRTRAKVEASALKRPGGLKFLELSVLRLHPPGEVGVLPLSDSGTVQKSVPLRVPNVTIRDVTERPRPRLRSNILSGRPADILRAVNS